jgi:hypothetical protein
MLATLAQIALSLDLDTAVAASTPQAPATMHAAIAASTRAWIEEPPAPGRAGARLEWRHGPRHTTIYVGFWVADLVSTEWAIATPRADGTAYHEGNPIPGMNHALGRAMLLPALGLAAAQVDRHLSQRGHFRWARAWRWACWLGEALQALANFRLIPERMTPMGALPRSWLRKS